ncbi:unnamed protein product [Alopecurus aequalis]
MRNCWSPSSLRGISRAAWRQVVAGALSPSGGSQNLPYLTLRPPAPPIALGLAERFFSSSPIKRSTKKKPAAKKGTPVESAGGYLFYVLRKGDVIVSTQKPDGGATSTLKKPQKMETRPSKKHPKVAELKPLPDSPLSCIEIDGSSGNPGRSGAGVIVRRPDGSVIAKLCEGLGIATYYESAYRGLLLGLRYAAENGFKYIHAQGSCELVCNQAQGLWRAKRANMVKLCTKVNELKGRFLQFQANPILKESNTDADAQAKFAVELPVGETRELSC